MRRHVETQQSYIDWLKSLGCVLWLPLSEGDLQEKISGQTATVSGNGSMTYYSDSYSYAMFDNGITGHVMAGIAPSLSSAQSGSYSNYNGANYYMRDMYLFDGSVDNDTIKIIQGIE